MTEDAKSLEWQQASQADDPPREGLDLSKGFDCPEREVALNWWLSSPVFSETARNGRARLANAAIKRERTRSSKSWPADAVKLNTISNAFRELVLREP